jgi:hypothetical protein
MAQRLLALHRKTISVVIFAGNVRALIIISRRAEATRAKFLHTHKNVLRCTQKNTTKLHFELASWGNFFPSFLMLLKKCVMNLVSQFLTESCRDDFLSSSSHNKNGLRKRCYATVLCDRYKIKPCRDFI